MAFAAARPESDTMADMNITPLLDYRLDLRLPQSNPKTQPPRTEQVLSVEPGDVFLLDGVAMSPAQVETTLAQWQRLQPDGVLKIVVDPDADYQSAATAMASVQRAGVANFGLVDP
jgi:biopolymer transport protein ExbD